MNFAVAWTRTALRQLTDLLIAATDQDAVSDASVEVERRLSADPLGEGEEREGDKRLVFIPPLAVVYAVDDVAGAVHVLSVGWSGDPV
jgi:mRNA-degrading endonuclease RelE of RelBE toxin-antitoxin system